MMTRAEVLSEVTKIFRDVFDDESLCVQESTSPEDVADWDSLSQINLLLELGNEFHVQFHVEDISSIRNIGSIVDLVFEKISAHSNE